MWGEWKLNLWNSKGAGMNFRHRMGFTVYFHREYTVKCTSMQRHCGGMFTGNGTSLFTPEWELPRHRVGLRFHLDSYRSPQPISTARTHHRSPLPRNPPAVEPFCLRPSIHALSSCLKQQQKDGAFENGIFLQRGDITCKSSEVDTWSSGSQYSRFTVPCLSTL